MTQKLVITQLRDKGLGSVELARQDLVSKISFMAIDKILPHEEILKERATGMESYVASLYPWTILPSILICARSFVIIDGHHRYYVLKKLGYENVPVTLINYDSDRIITHDDDNKMLEKKYIVDCGYKNQLLKPKSTMHHCVYGKNIFPIILLSDLRALKYG
jgi:hypothetical protein